MIGRAGERLNLSGLRLVQKTWYEKPIRGRDEICVVWRFAFLDPKGERIVYSGKWLPLEEGQKDINLRATIKRHDSEYNLTRIMRPAILPVSQQREMLI